MTAILVEVVNGIVQNVLCDDSDARVIVVYRDDEITDTDEVMSLDEIEEEVDNAALYPTNYNTCIYIGNEDFEDHFSV